jgi:hypothetical protein
MAARETLGVTLRRTLIAAAVATTPISQPSAAEYWTPTPSSTWDLQFDGPIDADKPVDVIDLDLFDTPPSLIAELQARGVRTVCYLSAGTIEEWRPDVGELPAAVVGNDYLQWPGERWLDIRRLDVIGPVMDRRLDLCRDKGFDGVDPDNMDGWQQDSGFPLAPADQIGYAKWFAEAAHARGLAVGLKNVPELVPELVDSFDWALTEDCFDQGWCGDMAPFIEAGKPVFAIEYTDTGVDVEAFCAEAARLGMSGIVKRRNLDAWTASCPPSK